MQPSRRSLFGLGAFMDLHDFGLLGGFRIIESPFMGRLFTPVVPARVLDYRGPYRQRRIRRWRRSHPSYTVGSGEYLIVSGREIWCHPDDAVQLRDIYGLWRI